MHVANPGAVEDIARMVRRHALKAWWQSGAARGIRRASGRAIGRRCASRRGRRFVDGGFVPDGATFDSLLVGYYTNDGRSQYEGCTACARNVRSMICRTSFPTAGGTRGDQRVTADDMVDFNWVPPSEVIEVAYLGWARHGLLRQGRFVGIGEDKRACQVSK
jgi:hypothetical protein